MNEQGNSENHNLIDLDPLYVPPEVLDSSDGRKLVEYLRSRNGTHRRQRLVCPTLKPVNISVKLRSKTAATEAENENNEAVEERQQIENEPLQGGSFISRVVNAISPRKETPPPTPAGDLSEIRRTPQKTPGQPAELPPPISAAAPRNNLLRRTILRNLDQRPPNFSEAVASTPCVAGKHDLNASVSPILNSDSPLKVLNPKEINTKAAPPPPNRVQVLEQIAIDPDNNTPLGILFSKVPKNISNMIGGQIPQRNENFEPTPTSSENSLVTEDLSVQSIERVEAIPQEASPEIPPQIPSPQKRGRRLSSSSSSSLSSMLLDGFNESMLPPHPVALSPAAPSLLQRVLKDMAVKDNTVKTQTFTMPANPVRTKKRKTNINPEANSYFDLSNNRKSQKSSNNTQKRRLYSEVFESPGAANNESRRQTRKTTQAHSRRTSPAKSRETSTRRSNGQSTAVEAQAKTPSLSRRQQIIEAQSRSVQTSLNVESPRKGEPKNAKRKPKDEARASKQSKQPYRGRELLASPLPLVESAEVVDGVRRSKRTRFYPGGGYWEERIPIRETDPSHYTKDFYPGLEKLKRARRKPKPVANPEPLVAEEAPTNDVPDVEPANFINTEPQKKAKKKKTYDIHEVLIVEDAAESGGASESEQAKPDTNATKKRGRPKEKDVSIVDTASEAATVTDHVFDTESEAGGKKMPNKRSRPKKNKNRAATREEPQFKVPEIPAKRPLQPVVVLRDLSKLSHTSADSGMQSEASHAPTQIPRKETTNNSVQVNIALVEPQSGLEWIPQLMTQKLGDPNFQAHNLEIPITNASFEQLAHSNNVGLKENRGITYVTYHGEAFRNCGYIRMNSGTRKPRAHTGRYSLQMLLLCGNVKVVIDENEKNISGGDIFLIRKGAKYSMENTGTSTSFLFFNKLLDQNDIDNVQK